MRKLVKLQQIIDDVEDSGADLDTIFVDPEDLIEIDSDEEQDD